MPFSISSIKSIAKGVLIEGFSLATVFIVNNLLREPEKNYDAVRLALDVRTYYLTKNILNVLDTLLTKENNFRHFYSGVFNMGVMALIYPASRISELTTGTKSKILLSESIIYAGAVLSRLFIESYIKKQSIVQHLLYHKGKLIGGASGVFFSLVPAIGRATPALYWSGELYDIWQSKSENESISIILFNAKSTVPIQAFFSLTFKTAARLLNVAIPLPLFSLDAVFGTAHRLVIDSFELDRRSPQTAVIEISPLKFVEMQSLRTDLSIEVIHNEIYNFASTYFKSIINDSNRPKYRKAFDDYILNNDQLSAQSMSHLKELNIVSFEQNKFFTLMTKKYGVEFRDNEQFLKETCSMFALKNHLEVKNSKYPSFKDCVHALKFNEHVKLYKRFLSTERLLSPSRNSITKGSNPNSFFTAEPSLTENKNQTVKECSSVRLGVRG